MKTEARASRRPRLVGRRAWVLGAAAAVACSKSERASGSGPPPPLPSSPNVRILSWDLGRQSWGQARAVVVVPAWGDAEARYPVVIALHGRGEAIKSPAEGALGWPRDYAMVRAFDRLRAPPLRESDYEGFVDPARLAETNASLAARPFGGVIVVCPWLPDFHPAATVDIAAYGRFLLGALLSRVRRETPAVPSPEATGIDGVSLGGVIALRIGLTSAESFGAVGGIQPAIGEGQNGEWTALARAARARRPTMKLRLLTSEEDYFRDAIISLSRAWRADGLSHDFADFPGPHDYVFNRGPGSIELLLWHDRALARS
jgi:iron(III)-salmochelin esterase